MKHVFTGTFKKENDRYYARIPDLPSCITTGRTLKEAIENLEDAMNL